jgi:hypothetical protein
MRFGAVASQTLQRLVMTSAMRMSKQEYLRVNRQKNVRMCYGMASNQVKAQGAAADDDGRANSRQQLSSAHA